MVGQVSSYSLSKQFVHLVIILRFLYKLHKAILKTPAQICTLYFDINCTNVQ